MNPDKYTQDNQLVYNINGVDYLLLDRLIMGDESVEKLMSNLQKIGGIKQGIKEIKRATFWHDGYCIIQILVPVDKIDIYNGI